MAGKKSEAAELKRIGATPVKNSGRSRGVDKGDGIFHQFVLDVKEYSRSFSVSRDVWKKISTDAITNGRKEPALFLVLGEEDERPIRLWVIGEDSFDEMHEAWREKYEIQD